MMPATDSHRDLSDPRERWKWDHAGLIVDLGHMVHDQLDLADHAVMVSNYEAAQLAVGRAAYYLEALVIADKEEPPPRASRPS